MNLFLPKRPRGACFVVLSSAGCKVGCRIRSDARTGRVLGAVLCPSCASWTNCRGSETDPRWPNVWGQKPFSPHIRSDNQQFKRVITFIGDLQKLDIPWILTHPLSSHVWRTSPVCLLEQHHHSHSIIFDWCAFGTPWKLRTKLIAGHCDYQDILSLAECSCEEHHVCAYSRRPSHLTLHGSDLDGRQCTARCKVLPPRLCSKLCNIIISREIGHG